MKDKKNNYPEKAGCFKILVWPILLFVKLLKVVFYGARVWIEAMRRRFTK